MSLLSPSSSFVCMCSIAMVRANPCTLSHSVGFLRTHVFSLFSHGACSYFTTLLRVSLVK